MIPGGYDLSQAVVVHGGGWKKLQERAVSNARFKQTLQEQCAIRRVHNYYAMVEQVGSIFVECTAGALHASNFSDIVIRHPETLAPQPVGEPGIIQVLSALPGSYPGHSILTEDLGRVLAEAIAPAA